VSTDKDGTAAIASVGDENSDIDNAEITVNDVMLTYGPSLRFRTEKGLDVDIILPFYYADLSKFTHGDALHLTARMSDGTMIYQRTNVTIPWNPTLVRPTQCQVIRDAEDVQMQWDRGAGAEGYVAGYAGGDEFSQDLAEDDAGAYAEYVDASITEATVPSAYTLVGDAAFSAVAVTGDTAIFTSEEASNESFFIATASDGVDAKIVADSTAQLSAIEQPSAVDRGSQGLTVAKEYEKGVQGYTFKIRECDPNQIQSPGTISLTFKLRRFKASIAFVEAYDMKGAKYFSWKKERIFHSSDREYTPSFSASPGTTVVFGTHDASDRGGTYAY
jgi:hypothetical protein